MEKENGKFLFTINAFSGEGRLVNTHFNQNSMEMIEIVSGKACVQLGTESILAGAGQFIYVPPKIAVRVDATEEKASVREMIFDTSILENNMDSFDLEVLYMFSLQTQNKILSFEPNHPIYGTIKKYMNEAYEEYSDKDICYKLPIKSYIYLMMTSLLRHYCGLKNDADKIIYQNVLRLRPVIEYIDQHYCEKIYIEDLSDMINVSADYFTKMFGISIGRTPIEYINSLRVNEAMRCLCETELSMGDIAEKIGFCNSNYFHKIFKHYMNISPLAYRKSTR